jgi:hypothetical protein
MLRPQRSDDRVNHSQRISLTLRLRFSTLCVSRPEDKRMERPRVNVRPESRSEQLDTRVEALRVVVERGAQPVASGHDDELLRRAGLEFLARAKERVLAAQQRCAQVEADKLRLEADLTARIEDMEARLRSTEEANARLQAVNAELEVRAAQADERSESANQFLTGLNDSLRDLAG